jgi:hypothetical protein
LEFFFGLWSFSLLALEHLADFLKTIKDMSHVFQRSRLAILSVDDDGQGTQSAGFVGVPHC